VVSHAYTNDDCVISVVLQPMVGFSYMLVHFTDDVSLRISVNQLLLLISAILADELPSSFVLVDDSEIVLLCQ